MDLKRVGLYRYFEHPSTSVTMLSYRVGETAGRWRAGWSDPTPLLDHIRAGRIVKAHNAAFERRAWKWLRDHVAPHWPALTIGHQDCTQARGRALALPGKLEMMGHALELADTKDAEGHRLMLKLSKPRSIAPDGTITWWEDPADIEREHLYCDQDVVAEAAIDGKIPPLSDSERRLWMLDQHINDRGFHVDQVRASRASAAVLEAKRRADREMWRLTGGAVEKASQAARIVSWIESRGVPCTSVAADQADELCAKAALLGDETVEKVVRLREASAVTFKFDAILENACADGRIRGSLAYHGAGNGRWTGRGVQPHNFKRLDTDDEIAAAKATVELLGLPLSPGELIDAIGDFTGMAPLEALSLCARAMICAEPGKKLVGGDFSNIEGRVNAWLAGEAWKVQAFRDYDAGTGPDLYKVMAGRVLGKEMPDVSKADRQLWGKVPELACGYQGGVYAFHKMGLKYGVRVPETQARMIVDAWRAENANIKAGWRELQDAAIDACANPGLVVPALAHRVSYRASHGMLWCQLPSKRVIAYPKPSLRRRHKVVMIDGDPVEFNNWGVTYWGEKKGYQELDLYGGAQCAHVVSGTARDILAGSMFRLEGAGYPLVLTVHDENLSEVSADFGSAEHYRNLMAQGEPWAKGLPIAASAWEDVSYVK